MANFASCEREVERYISYDSEILADPYPLFRQLLTEDPVHWSPAFDSWLVARHSDVVSSSRDLCLSSVRMPVSVQNEVLSMARQF